MRQNIKFPNPRIITSLERTVHTCRQLALARLLQWRTRGCRCRSPRPSGCGSPPPPHGANSCRYSHFFAFGDSLTDTGNFIRYAVPPGSESRPPYGETFFHRPTGRWSDGRLIVDFIVERLGLPYWPPYLAGKTAEDFRYGARQDQQAIMASSLFLIGEIGANDYIHPFFQNKTLGFVKPLIPRVIRFIGLSISTLIKLGARTLYVTGVFPLGCLPRYLFFFSRGSGDYPAVGDYNPAVGCLWWLNDLTAHHNALLKLKLAELRRAHPGVTIVYVDYYGEVLSVVAAPARYGFDGRAVLDACCNGGGPYNGNFTLHCSDRGAVRCADPSRYVSWTGCT
ncbi:hypothetical protein ACP4OV_028287 [Aristida adscensionis]